MSRADGGEDPPDLAAHTAHRGDEGGEGVAARGLLRRRADAARVPRRRHGVGAQDGGELARVRLALRLRGGELLLQGLDLAPVHVHVGRQNQGLHRAVELEPAAVAHRHPGEPGPLAPERRRLVRTEVHPDLHVVPSRRIERSGAPLALDGSPACPMSTWSIRRSSDSSPNTLVPSPISIWTRASGAISQRRAAEINLAPTAARHRVSVDRGEHADRLVEAVQRALHPAAPLVAGRRWRHRLRRHRHPDARSQLLGSAPRLLGSTRPARSWSGVRTAAYRTRTCAAG